MAFNLFYFSFFIIEYIHLFSLVIAENWKRIFCLYDLNTYYFIQHICFSGLFTNERILFVFNFHSKLRFSDNLNSFSMLFLKQILFFYSNAIGQFINDKNVRELYYNKL